MRHLLKEAKREPNFMKDHTLEELDIAIPDMLTEADEVKAGEMLRQLHGVAGVRVVQRGALVAYRAASITKDEICHALRQVGYRGQRFPGFEDGADGLFYGLV